MRKFLYNLKAFGVVLIVAAAIVAGMWLDYKVFQVNHPGAPWWGYLLHGK